MPKKTKEPKKDWKLHSRGEAMEIPEGVISPPGSRELKKREPEDEETAKLFHDYDVAFDSFIDKLRDLQTTSTAMVGTRRRLGEKSSEKFFSAHLLLKMLTRQETSLRDSLGICQDLLDQVRKVRMKYDISMSEDMEKGLERLTVTSAPSEFHVEQKEKDNAKK